MRKRGLGLGNSKWIRALGLGKYAKKKIRTEGMKIEDSNKKGYDFGEMSSRDIAMEMSSRDCHGNEQWI